MTGHERDYLQERVDEVADAQAAQHVELATIKSSCQRIETCLLGNGQPGLVVRTDRLEQKEKTRSRLLWLVVSGVVVLILNAVASHIGLAQ